MRSKPTPTRPDLDALLEAAKVIPMTRRDKWFQRVSFVYGNAKLSNDRITYEQVFNAACAEYGPPPEDERA